MSLAAVRPYFSQHISALGFTEWTEPFGQENIPSTLIDKTFHQRTTGVASGSTNYTAVEFLVSQEIRLFFKGFKEPVNAVNEAMISAETVIIDLLNPSKFNDEVKAVRLSSLEIEPFDEGLNDNIVLAVIEFDVVVYSCI